MRHRRVGAPQVVSEVLERVVELVSVLVPLSHQLLELCGSIALPVIADGRQVTLKAGDVAIDVSLDRFDLVVSLLEGAVKWVLVRVLESMRINEY